MLGENPDDHYAEGIQTFDVIQAKLTKEQWIGFLLGNIMKYSLRANFKGQFDSDMRKCMVYNEKLRVSIENQEESVRRGYTEKKDGWIPDLVTRAMETEISTTGRSEPTYMAFNLREYTNGVEAEIFKKGKWVKLTNQVIREQGNYFLIDFGDNGQEYIEKRCLRMAKKPEHTDYKGLQLSDCLGTLENRQPIKIRENKLPE